MEKGRYQEAIATIEKASDLDPQEPEPYLRLALIYEECLQDAATALRYYHTYQRLETDEVKKEEIRGWIEQLEQHGPRELEATPENTSPGLATRKGQPEVTASANPGPGQASDPDPSHTVEESLAYRALEAKLTAALSEIKKLKAESKSAVSPPEGASGIGQQIENLESENESLRRSLQEARATALRNEQGAARATKRNEELRSTYESQITDLKGKVATAEQRLRELEGKARESGPGSEKVARLEKSIATYSATLSSLQRANDDLKRENASLRARLRRAGGGVRHHTVRAGETLKTIAGYPSVYGDSKMWVVIYQANRDKVSNPNNLKPGLVLVIPPE